MFNNCKGTTDIGGGRENQDDYFIMSLPNGLLFGVLDGHGRNTGKLISKVVKDSFIEFFADKSDINIDNAYEYIMLAFEYAHNRVRDRLIEKYNQDGWEINQVNGYY